MIAEDASESDQSLILLKGMRRVSSPEEINHFTLIYLIEIIVKIDSGTVAHLRHSASVT